LIYALQRARPADRERLIAVLDRASRLKPAEVERVVETIACYDGFAAARDKAAQFVREARRDLAMLPAGPARDGLACLAGKAVERSA
jgi:geranylgeranyl pyrophosphate synthase